MSGPSGQDVLKCAAQMMSELLLQTEGLSDLTTKELMERLEITRNAATGILGESFFLPDDGFALCQALGFDLGIAVRKSDGSEFIFYPAKNFGLHSMQSDPKPAKLETPPTPPAAIPAPPVTTSAGRPPSVLLPAATHGSVSALPFSTKKGRTIGFLQQFLHPTPKADTADPENPFPGINEYEV